MSVLFGVDLGGTTVQAIAQDGSDTIAEAQIATRTGSSDAVVASILDVVDQLTGQIDQPASALGLGIPGIVDPAAGTVSHALNLGIGAAFPVARTLGDRLDGLPVVIENDVRVGAAGAQLHFPGEHPSLVYLGIGTGIAAGVIIDGEIYRGTHGMAGEIGHSTFAPSAVTCSCGRTGCLEAIAAGPAISAAWPHGPHAASDLFEQAAAGSPDAQRVAAPVTEHLAVAIEQLIAIFDPSIVVLGGGVGSSTPALRDLLITQFAQMTHNVLISESDLDQRLRQLPAGWPAGAYGAAEIARTTANQEKT